MKLHELLNYELIKDSIESGAYMGVSLDDLLDFNEPHHRRWG